MLKFSITYSLCAFLLLALSGCSHNSEGSQIQTSTLPNAVVSPLPQNASEETPEQIITKLADIGLNKDLEYDDKINQPEKCCLAAVEQEPPKEPNTENMKKLNPAHGEALSIGLLYTELVKLENKCQNEQDAVIKASFRAKTGNLIVAQYYKLIKQNSKWRVQDLSSQGTFTCSLNLVAHNQN